MVVTVYCSKAKLPIGLWPATVTVNRDFGKKYPGLAAAERYAPGMVSFTACASVFIARTSRTCNRQPAEMLNVAGRERAANPPLPRIGTHPCHPRR